MSENEQRDECLCCGFSPVKVKPFKPTGENTETLYYCALCYGSLASRFDRLAREEAPVLQTICYVGNALLAAMRGEPDE